MTRPALALAALLLAGSTAAAPDRTAALRTTAAPIWKGYTREHVASLAKTGGYIRTVFRHDPKAVRYTVKGNAGTVTAAGTALATAPASTEAEARKTPWVIRRPATLTLRFTWRDGLWQPGPVEWKQDTSH